MDIWKKFNELCAPAQLYLVISLISVLAMLYQNYSHPQQYCVGLYKQNLYVITEFTLYLNFYILLYGYLFYKNYVQGYKTISWIIVLLPIIGMFILIGLLFIFLMKKTNTIAIL